MIGGAKGIGLGIDLGLVNQYNRTGSQSYIDPEVLDSLVGVWDAYGMTNNSPNKTVIKNKLSNRGGDFVISNAAFKLNSGFGKYSADFESFDWAVNISQKQHNKATISLNGRLCNHTAIEIDEMKVNIIGNVTELIYWYIANPDDTTRSEIRLTSGINTLPKSYAKDDGQTYNIGFAYISGDSEITIEQIPSFEGAFVTDGIDDLITSTKTVQEMLGGSNEITVVSMIHQIDLNSTYTIATTNYIENSNSREHVRSDVYNYGKTGIYGYSASLINNTKSDIKNILGDEADYYVKSTNSLQTIFDAKFSVVGRISELTEASQVAWYWTIIANKVLTTDQINQVIAYFNLDRTLKPDILCNTIKQGITNENHAEFGDKLIDYSGNGRDIQLNNIAWKGDSGIGKYEVDFNSLDRTDQSELTTDYKSIKISKIKQESDGNVVYNWGESLPAIDSVKIRVRGLDEVGARLTFIYLDDSDQNVRKTYYSDGTYDLPSSAAHEGVYITNFRLAIFGYKGDCNITIEQIPSHAGGLCLDGVNDFGQFVGDLGLKDYTFIMDREYLSLKADQVPVISSINPSTDTPFIFEHCVYENRVARPFSFGKDTVFSEQLVSKRLISYQSTYKYNGKDISKGTSVNTGSGLTIGRYGDDRQYANFAFYFLMLFPYSMSEFLIERQLKKYKLGTLYQDMVEFRPVIKSNVLLDAKPTFVIRGTSTYLNAGDYVPENSQIWVSIKMNNAADRITKFTVNGKTIDIPENAYSEVTLQYGFPFVIDKSPQKIGITIEQDENYVQWNPIIESNVEYDNIVFYYRDERIENGTYLPIDSPIGLHIRLSSNPVNEINTITVNGVPATFTYHDTNNNIYQYNFNLTSKSPQKINITIDEYIRYEDIVQPYPDMIELKQNDKYITWGDKLKVGSEIVYYNNYNLNPLSKLYNLGVVLYNGNPIYSGNIIEVKKDMTFTSRSKWKFDDNEPNCILSPRLLRIPNSSYKILGHIPDISGHGNHGVIHNSAYAGMSGVNGYVENFTKWTVSKPPVTVSTNEERIKISYIGTSYKTLPIFEYSGSVNENYSLTVEIQGIPDNVIGKFIHNNGFVQEVTNGINTIKFSNSGSWYGFTFYREDNTIIGNCDITIKQIGEYEGAFCFDGVDDFVTIPTLSSGGKQVLMKVNQSNVDSCLYTQVSAGIGQDRMTTSLPTSLAYQGRWEITNWDKVYIDGIENNNITNEQLYDITHIITVISRSSVETVSPIIGALRVDNALATFAKMALYDFMLFDNISTDDKIKELNEYVGIEAKVELPPYYFDTHGKTNLDDDRDYIANLGTVQDVIEVSQPAIFAEEWYDYYESFVSRSPIINQTDYSIEVKPTHMDNNFNMLLSVNCDTPLPAFRAKFTRTSNVDVSYAEIRYGYYVNGEWTYIDIFGENNSAESVILDIPASEKSSISGSNADNFPNILIEVLPADNSVRYGLSNKNFAYDKMSGYGGYNLGRFDNDWSYTSNNDSIEVISRDSYSVTLKNLSGTNDWKFNNTKIKIISDPITVRFKSDKEVIFTCDYHYFSVGSDAENTIGHTGKRIIAGENTDIIIPPISQENIDKYNMDISRGYYLIYFRTSPTLSVDEEVTIEMLPLYDGLVYDGVDDNSENTAIPAFTDYTYILKRQILKGIANSAVMYKGNITVNQGGAFICNYCEPSNTNLFTDFSFGGLLRNNDINKPIIYGTKTSVNGNSITPGEKIDTVGINVGKWVNYLPMVFYKLILYPKTIPLLQINFLKNLMERDEIIDLNNPIFVQE